MPFFRALIGPHIVAGSTRQQPVGRINPVVDCGDGDEDEDKDEDEDEIPSSVVLLAASVERFCFSGMRDIFLQNDAIEFCLL